MSCNNIFGMQVIRHDNQIKLKNCALLNYKLLYETIGKMSQKKNSLTLKFKHRSIIKIIMI